MRAALHLCREYGQPLAWWEGMETGEQALYLADLRLRQEADERRAAALNARGRRGR